MPGTRQRAPKRPRVIAVFEPAPLELPGLSPTEAKIVDAARRCLLQYTSAKVSLNDVARAAGVSRATVYNYFTDRDALLRTVLEVMVAIQAEDFDRRMSEHETLEDQVAAAAECFLEWVEAEKASGKMVGADREKAAMAGSEWVMRRLIDLLRPRIIEAIARGEVRAGLDVGQAAEWMSRAILSLAFFPGVTLDITRPDEVTAWFKAYAVAGLR